MAADGVACGRDGGAEPDRWYHDALRWLIRVTVRLAFAVFGRLRIEGTDNVPLAGGVLLAPNHVSAADWPAIGVSCPRPLRWVAKSDLFDVPVIGPFCRLFRAFPIQRGAPDRAALRLAEELVRAGDALVVFPEGAVSETARLQPLKHGLAMIALRSGAPVVPVAIQGTERLLPYGSNLPRPVWKPVRVRFGAPIAFVDLWVPPASGSGRTLPPRAAIEAATTRVETALRRMLTEC
jgi:1-acyl-sn-glycerol-3-phosphate acyltransferase